MEKLVFLCPTNLASQDIYTTFLDTGTDTPAFEVDRPADAIVLDFAVLVHMPGGDHLLKAAIVESEAAFQTLEEHSEESNDATIVPPNEATIARQAIHDHAKFACKAAKAETVTPAVRKVCS